MKTPANKYLEIEYKYKTQRDKWDAFVTKCRIFNPVSELRTGGPDTYYTKGTQTLRWRYGEDISQLTMKSRMSNWSPLVRTELEINLERQSPRNIISFIHSLGFKKLFRIYKDCHIFWFATEEGKVSVVIYRVIAKNREDAYFIEIEAEKGQSLKTSKGLIRMWQERLGLTSTQRSAETLLEIYSEQRTELFGDNFYYKCETEACDAPGTIGGLCGKCVAKKYRVNNPEKVKEACRKWRSVPKNKLKIMEDHASIKGRYRALRYEARSRGLSLGISQKEYENIVSPNICTYCGGALGRYGSGLDRKNNALGYEKDNVLPCCGVCNVMRGDRVSVSEMRAIIGVLKSTRQCEGVWDSYRRRMKR